MFIFSCRKLIKFSSIVLSADSTTAVPASTHISVIGSPLQASRAGVDAANSTLILIDRIPDQGVLFAYAAYFRHATALRLQVWRLLDILNDLSGKPQKVENIFELVHEIRVIPSLIGEEIVSLTLMFR